MNKYELIVQDLKTDIAIGTYPAYSRLPSVAQLCEQYEVSKITINKALEVLEQQGLIFRRKGSGTFVKKLKEGTQIKPSKEVSGQMEGFMAEHAARGERVKSKVYTFEVERPSEY
ncbi:MAG: GntR family transcriptional regulator, partial [Lancefieldella parvula]|nr:GntR family transcriptional regulator [Lancefieldella parvula]